MLERRAAFAVVLVLGIAGLVDANSADAQPYYYRTPFPYYEPYYVTPYGAPRFATDGLPLHQIMRAVRLAGYLPISAPVRRGSAYVVVASAPGRGPVRVAINAYAGEIVSVTPATIFRPDGGVAQDFPPPRNGVRGPEVLGSEELENPSGREPQTYSRPNVGLRNPPREISTDRLANVPAANAPAANAPVARSLATPPNGSAAARVPMPRPRPSGTAARDSTAGAAPAKQGTASADGGTPMVLPLPVQSSGAGNTGPAKTGNASGTTRPDTNTTRPDTTTPDVTRSETTKSATTKSETVLVPVAPLD